MEKLGSRTVLSRAIERLGWTTGGELEHEQAFARLVSMLTTDSAGNQVTLRVRHPDPEQSCAIVWALIESYGDYRAEVERGDTERRLAELKAAVEAQEKVIAEAREKLAEIVRNTKPELLQSGSVQAEAPKPPMTDQELAEAGRKQAAQTRQKALANRVVLREAPMVPKWPLAPRAPLNLTIGALAGLVVSPVLAGGVFLFGRGRRRRSAGDEVA
jgi:hypothetical protein